MARSVSVRLHVNGVEHHLELEPRLLLVRALREARALVAISALVKRMATSTRGMRAAIPHTDRLLSGNWLASLEELAAILEVV
jgi:uncharacterized protein with von Willebrand factor type A (vWA) domain